MTTVQNLQSNPLVNPPKLPHGAPAFDLIKTEHFVPAIDYALALAIAEIDAIKNNADAPTFANTIEALEFAGGELSRISGIYHTFTNSKNSDELRATEDGVAEKMEKYSSDIFLDDVLFARVDAVYQVRSKLKLDAEQKALLEKTHKGFVRKGALLSPDDKQRFREIGERLAALGVQYSTNDVKSTEAYKQIIDDEAALDGVPERAKNAYKKAAEDLGLSGKWLIQLEPHPSDILTHATNRDLRRDITNALWNVGSQPGKYDNRPIILEMVALRHEAAQLMGYPTHAEYVLADRMAGNQKTVEGFLQKNLAAYKPAAEEFLDKVKAYALQKDGITDFQKWDLPYYSRMLKEETYSISMEAVRPYFELNNVLDGLRQHAEKLFNVQLKEAGDKYPVYSPDVTAYEVIDKKSGETISLFYTNYYATAGVKRGGAWMNAMRDRGVVNGQDQIPVITNDCNYQRPVGDKPVLLSLGEVETIYHEFGHGLHGACAKGKYPSLNGTNVKWDWVELPSQLQENWVLQKDVLDTFARHIDTQELLPADLLKKMQDMRNFDSGYAGLRQTYLAMLDMAWHTTDPAKLTTVEDMEDSVGNVASLIPRGQGTMSGGFGHLFGGGYDSGYYSYKWAEVLEADVFERFLQNGLYDKKTAKGVLTHIYQSGGKIDPAQLYKKLMGRDPDPEALFRREGIVVASAPQTQNKNPAPKP